VPFIKSNFLLIKESQLETKKIFFLITVITYLLTSPANANLRSDDVNSAHLNDRFMLEHKKIAAEDDFTNLSIGMNPESFPGRGPKFWGPSPDNPGYSHFIERPNVGVPPFVSVVPEPVSYLLFIAGGAVLAGRRYFKRKK